MKLKPLEIVESPSSLSASQPVVVVTALKTMQMLELPSHTHEWAGGLGCQSGRRSSETIFSSQNSKSTQSALSLEVKYSKHFLLKTEKCVANGWRWWWWMDRWVSIPTSSWQRPNDFDDNNNNKNIKEIYSVSIASSLLLLLLPLPSLLLNA